MPFKKSTDGLAKALLLPINPAAVVLLGFYTVAWGLWVANPFWEVFTQAKMFGAMANIAPEWLWGAIAVVFGAVTVYGAVKRLYRPLVRGAVAAFIHWIVIAAFYLVADFANTGGITSLFLAIYAGFIYLNLRVNFKDDKDSDEILSP